MAESTRFPKIKLALDDGFYVLAELLSKEVLDSDPREKDEQEAILLMAHALWGQKRHEDILTLFGDNEKPSAGAVYWTARSNYELKRFDTTLSLLKDGREQLSKSRLAPSATRLLGHTEAHLGLLDAATATFIEFNKNFPDHAELSKNKFDLANTYQRHKKYQEAIAIYEEVAAGPDKNAAELAQLKLGRLLYTQGAAENFAEARNLLVKLATNEKAQLVHRIDAWVELAELEEKAGEQDAAATSLNQAVILSPDARQRVPLKLALARMMLRNNDTKSALKLLEECRTEAPNETIAAELQLEKAGALSQAKQFEEADTAYQIYLDVSTDKTGRGRAWFGKGLCLWELNRFIEASSAFDKATHNLEGSSERALALFKAGDAYYQAKRFEAASQRYKSFVADYPSHELLPNALYQLGLSLNNNANSSEAMETFKVLEAQFAVTEFAEQAAMRIADLMKHDNRWNDALEKYLEIDRTYTNISVIALSRHQAGLVLYELGRHEEALKAFDSVTTELPASEHTPQAAYMRGFCLHRLGKVAQAEETCREFISNYPDSEWAPEVIFWLAEQQFNQGNYAEADKLFMQVVSEHKDHISAPRALYRAGRAATKQKDYTTAIKRYNKLAKEYPNSSILPQTRYAQGDVLSQQADHVLAILAFEEIIKNYPESDLVNAALGRKGDCQFKLAANAPERYREAQRSFQSILDRPEVEVPLALRLQAEFKIGRCLEKMGQPDKAFGKYMHVVYTYLSENGEYAPEIVEYFTRSVFRAAAIKEKERAWDEAVKIYQRVIEKDLPASKTAQDRIDNIKKENWLLFQQP